MQPSSAMRLTDEQFMRVLATAPLVSIDLVIRDSKGRILLGRRTNEPAKGKWFVPGGCIQKGETLEQAFERICLDEINERHARSEARFVNRKNKAHFSAASPVPPSACPMGSCLVRWLREGGTSGRRPLWYQPAALWLGLTLGNGSLKNSQVSLSNRLTGYRRGCDVGQ